MKFRYVINPRAIALLGLMAILAVILAISVSPLYAQSPPVNNADQPALDVEVLVDGLNRPWDLSFTPDETMLFTQRSGVLSARLTDGTVQTITADFSDFRASGEGGFMAILVDPNFNANRRFYTCQTHMRPREVQVIAWTINADYTEATRVDDPLVGGISGGGRHSGCRLRFGPSGYLWIATGDGTSGTVPQDLTALGGKVLRVNASNGAGAPGNPFSSSPLVYTYGHRNVQGLARRPVSCQMWSVEHGPSTDDEINLLVSGGNYGWDPVPGYDEGVSMTDLTKYPDAVEAKWSSGSPTLATSGGIFLVGSHWGDWEGRFAVASLKDSTLRIFEFANDGAFVNQVVVSELNGTFGRLRTPMMGPDGALFVTTSNGSNDMILRVAPEDGVTELPRPSCPRHITQSGSNGDGTLGGFGPAPVAPKFDDGFRTERELPENAAPGDAVGDPVAATHQDELAITYSLSGTDASKFTVEEHTGQLRVREGVALILASTFTVNLTATDSAGFGAIIIVDIEVIEPTLSPYDLNDNGVIERDEVIEAVADYFAGEIEKDEVIELIKLYVQES